MVRVVDLDALQFLVPCEALFALHAEVLAEHLEAVQWEELLRAG